MRAPSGYPQRHWDVVANAWRSSALIVFVLGVPTLALALYVYLRGGPLLVAAVAGAISVYAVLAAVGQVWDCRHVRIIPYFERRVGEIDTFLAGAALARSLLLLDELAAARGVTPLSAYGFGDDLRGEAVVWHMPDAGLQTVRTLAQALEAEPERLRDAAAAQQDLARLEQALERAQVLGVRFALLLRHGNATSALEWERRAGSAF